MPDAPQQHSVLPAAMPPSLNPIPPPKTAIPLDAPTNVVGNLWVVLFVFPMLLGVLFGFLVQGEGPSIGVGFVLWALAIVGLTWKAIHTMRVVRNPWMHLLLVPYVVIAVDLAIYASETTSALGCLGLVALYILWVVSVTSEVQGHPLFLSGRSLVRSWLFVLGLLPAYMRGTDRLLTYRKAKTGRKTQWGQIALGSVLGLFIAIGFLSLFMSADPLFADILEHLPLWNAVRNGNWIWQTIRTLLIAGVFGGAISGVIWPLWSEKEKTKGIKEKPSYRTMVVTILVILNALFLVFLCVQVSALLGGETYLHEFGLTYATYAREGFFQLLIASGIAFLIAGGMYRGEDWTHKTGKKTLVGLLGGYIAMSLILVASAGMRLALYVDAYGQTVARFYAASVIALIAVLLGYLLVTVIVRVRWEIFVATGAWTLIMWLSLMLSINVEGIVAQYDLRHFNSEASATQDVRAVDKDYLNTLSSDVLFTAPQLLRAQRNKLCGWNGEMGRRGDDQECYIYLEDWRGMTLSEYRLTAK